MKGMDSNKFFWRGGDENDDTSKLIFPYLCHQICSVLKSLMSSRILEEKIYRKDKMQPQRPKALENWPNAVSCPA
jgi:hypothetical protein